MSRIRVWRSPRVGIGSESYRRASLREIILPQSRRRRTPNACSGRRTRSSKRRSITFTALWRGLRAFDSATEGSRQAHFEALADHHRQLADLGGALPGEFRKPRRAGRRGNRPDRRPRPRRRAPVRTGHPLGPRHGFVHNEALACEIAARFYAARGFETFADVVSAQGPRRLSALGRRRQGAATRCGFIRIWRVRGTASAAATTPPDQHLDVASVVKASQALSGEIVLPKLIDRLMKIAIENAGADRGLLILPSGDEYLIQAEARATGDQIEVTMRQEPITGIACPESLVRYVIRTRESVILDDASKPNLFSDGRLSARSTIEVDPLPAADQTTGIDRDSPPRKCADFARIHTGSDRGPGTAGGASRDLAGEHASLWRSPGTGEQGPTPCRLQYHRDYASSISTVGSSRPTTRFSSMLGYEREDFVSGRTALDRPDAGRNGATGDAKASGGVDVDRNLAAITRRNISGKTAAACRCWSARRRFGEHRQPGRRLRRRPDRAKARRGRTGAREPRCDNGPTRGLHCPRSQPTYRRPAYECRNRRALARPSAAKFGKGQAVDRPHYQRRQAGR